MPWVRSRQSIRPLGRRRCRRTQLLGASSGQQYRVTYVDRTGPMQDRRSSSRGGTGSASPMHHADRPAPSSDRHAARHRAGPPPTAGIPSPEPRAHSRGRRPPSRVDDGRRPLHRVLAEGAVRYRTGLRRTPETPHAHRTAGCVSAVRWAFSAAHSLRGDGQGRVEGSPVRRHAGRGGLAAIGPVAGVVSRSGPVGAGPGGGRVRVVRRRR